MRRQLGATCLVIALSAMAGHDLRAQETGMVAGRITDAGGAMALQSVRVSIAGTGLAALTDEQGRYVITRVPAGEVTVTAELIGRETASRRVTVTAGETTVVDFALALSAFALDAVVVTGTAGGTDRKSTRLNSSHVKISYAVFCLKK